MPADRLLSTLLRSLQTYSTQQDTPRLLGTAVSLLTSLNNPLNITLLTSQLLSAPAIWTRPDGLRTALGVMSVFNSSAIRCLEREFDPAKTERLPFMSPLEVQLSSKDWLEAVIKGADGHSLRSHHLLGLGGALIGFASRDEEFLRSSLGLALQGAFVKAVNLALEEPETADELSQGTIALALNHVFVHLSDLERANIDYDRLLPVLMHSTLHSFDGLRSGYFLGAADMDVQQYSSKQFNWPKASASFRNVETILSSPLISSLGPLSRLVAHTIEHARDAWLVLAAVEDVADFCKRLNRQWRQNKLSEIDVSEEAEFLHEEARAATLPSLWKLLRSTMFASVIILRSAIGRALSDPILACNEEAPHIAQETLHALRHLSFVTDRLSTTPFAQYTFTHLTAIDILSASAPHHAAHFLATTLPPNPSSIPSHPLDRSLALFHLNTSEHFPFLLDPATTTRLILTPTLPYLSTSPTPTLTPLYEAAHAAILSLFAAPQNLALTTTHLPFYLSALFAAFPSHLSPRQFRLAFSKLVQVVSPPTALSAQQPLLAATLLELLRERAEGASTAVLLPAMGLGPASPPVSAASDADPTSADVRASGNETRGTTAAQTGMSEQAALVHTLVASLPHLAPELLEEWLPITAGAVNGIGDEGMRGVGREALWEVLVGGGLDPRRSLVGVGWWVGRGEEGEEGGGSGSGSGREEMLYGGGEGDGEVVMSGALGERARL